MRSNSVGVLSGLAVALAATSFDVNRINGSHEERRARASKMPRKYGKKGNGHSTDPHNVQVYHKERAILKRNIRKNRNINLARSGGYHYARV